jgi:protein TIF31
MLNLIRVCNQMDVMLAARKYEFEAESPLKTSDMLDLQSIVKHLSPVCVDARDLLESGKLRLAQVSYQNL